MTTVFWVILHFGWQLKKCLFQLQACFLVLGHNLLKGVYLANDDIAAVQVNEPDAVPIAGHILSKLLKALKRKLEVQI